MFGEPARGGPDQCLAAGKMASRLLEPRMKNWAEATLTRRVPAQVRAPRLAS